MPCASAWLLCPGSSRRKWSGAYPDRLVVTVTEAEPLALWQRKQKLFLVSRTGKVIETADLRKYSELLVIVVTTRRSAPRACLDLLAQQPKLAGAA